MKRRILIIWIIGALCIGNFAQENDDLKRKSYQVTFITPIGTNGTLSTNYINELSLNVLAGYNGGLDGFELGGFANLIDHDAFGLQLAGFANIVKGKVSGAQISGFLNLSNKSSEGMQLGGFGNLSGNSFNGLQVSGFGNITNGNSELVQIGGFGNLNVGDIEGLQISGFMNVSEKMEGFQAAGFMNIAEDVNGAQIAGFLNIAEHVDGLQLGFLNICDSIEGLPIGFLSIVENGYRKFEFWGGEALHTNLAYKMGVEKFYNIFAIGGHFTGGFKWGTGYGIGSQFRINESAIFNLEALYWDIRKDWTFRDYMSLNQLRMNFGMEYLDGKSFFVGPTLNVLVTSNYRANATRFSPYAFYNRTSRNDTNVKIWLGINAGVRF